MIWWQLTIITGLGLIGIISYVYRYSRVAILFLFIMGFSLLTWGLAPAWEEQYENAPYYKYGDKFCEYYNMKYYFADCFFCESKRYCIEETENDILVRHEIAYTGERYGFINKLSGFNQNTAKEKKK